MRPSEPTTGSEVNYPTDANHTPKPPKSIVKRILFGITLTCFSTALFVLEELKGQRSVVIVRKRVKLKDTTMIILSLWRWSGIALPAIRKNISEKMLMSEENS